MKFVVAGYGSRGDVEPCAAVARELVRRGHEVRMAVPPNMLEFVESAGLNAVAYGPDSQALQHDDDFVRDVSARMHNPISLLPDAIKRATEVWAQKSATLTSLSEGADLIVAGITEQVLAANVAEYHGISLASLHLFPAQALSLGWLHAQITKECADAQRRVLGLPEIQGHPTVLTESLEIQTYEQFCAPEPAGNGGDCSRRPFVGSLTLQLPTDTDDEALSWIADGAPPIYFGFGSTPVTFPVDTVAVIDAACAQLGARALICSGPNNFADIPHGSHVKVVAAVNHAAVLPSCRAVVHHGGAGTTAAGMRAGIPMLILWLWLDQPIWAATIERLKIGVGRPFSTTTLDSLVADIRLICTAQFAARAREVATRMTKSTESLAHTADLLEVRARRGRVS